MPETKHRVLDGGSRLHRIPTESGTRLWKIAKGCEEGSTIKNGTHQRRGHNNIHTVFSFTAETDLSGEKEEFLSEAQPNRE